MHEIRIDKFGKPYLVWTNRKREPGERGVWVEIGHKNYYNIEEIVQANKQLGLDVLIDEEGFYRAFILKD